MAKTEHRLFERLEIEQSIYARFAEQVAQFPDRPAVWTPQVQWTYKELSTHVDAMAGALLHRIGSGEGRVALIFDHGAPMIAGILSAMRAGKAYVPLDPGYPEQRLQMMLRDSTAEALLIESKHLNLASRLGGAELPVVVAEEVRHSPGMTFPPLGPRDIAYILYTSGSTGRPKGVVQNHRNVLHFIRAYTNNLLLAPSDRLTLLSSYSFDAAVMGIFGGLLNGACVCPRSVKDGGFGDLGAWIQQAGISIYHSTPTVFREFVAVVDPGERFQSVRRVVLGGEAVVRRDVELFKRHFDRGAILINGLGPTESTITLQYFIDHDTELTSNLVPVGRPVSDTRIVLLDEAGQETDHEGEMMFVSEHVALEYWHRPDLNSQAFGKFPGAPGIRWYRSGDLARWRGDGNLEFLGRKDLQIKINGVRIELGDIEAALERQPGVAEAVVVGQTLPTSPGLPRLVAYLRRPAAAGAIPRRHAEQIREGVRALLPNAMVPNIIVFVDAYPKTPTGKIDRLALPDRGDLLQLDEQGDETSYVPPSNDVERNLAKLWQEMLGIEKVSVTDNFQSLGGDSLTALRLLLRMKTLGIPLEVARGIFQGKTIRQLANPDDPSARYQSSAATKGDGLAKGRTSLNEKDALQPRRNLLVNLVRAILLALVIGDHWLTPSLLNLPKDWAYVAKSLFAIFNLATPGFCFVFGLALGRIYYPIFKETPRRAQSMLFSGMVMLLVGVALTSTWALLLSKEPLSTTQVVMAGMMWPSGPLLYYAIALGTAPLWFRIMSWSKNELAACVAMIAVLWSCYQAANLLLGGTPGDDVEAILQLIFLTKFSYFNMSMGALAGVATGIYLINQNDQSLPIKSIVFGTIGILVGLGLLYGKFETLAPLYSFEARVDMGIWRWVLYCGVVIIILGALELLMERYRALPGGLQRLLELVAVFGQCTFPIYVLHLFVIEGKDTLVSLGTSRAFSTAIMLVIFALLSSWFMRKLHQLHYGPVAMEA